MTTNKKGASMERTIKVSSENFDKLDKLAKKEGKMKKWLLDKALENYFKAKGLK